MTPVVAEGHKRVHGARGRARRWVRAALAGVAVPLGVVGGALLTPGAAADEAAAPAAVVVLGDSYSSGLGAGAYTDDCDRTPRAWGNLIFAEQVDDRTLLACSGARLPDVRAQVTQLAALPDAGERLVTVTVGGNDVGFATEIQNCLLSLRSCTARESTIRARIQALRAPLAQLYRDVQAAAPGDEVVVGGYPLLVADPGARTGCSALTFAISNAERRMIRSLGAELNDVIDAAAADAGVRAVGTELEATFGGHEACANGSADWIYGLRISFRSAEAAAAAGVVAARQPGGDALVTVRAEPTDPPDAGGNQANPLASFVSDSFHPTRRGQQAYADVFARAWSER